MGGTKFPFYESGQEEIGWRLNCEQVGQQVDKAKKKVKILRESLVIGKINLSSCFIWFCHNNKQCMKILIRRKEEEMKIFSLIDNNGKGMDFPSY